jgi:hypothetical protein
LKPWLDAQEALIMRAAEDGLVIERRPNASPAAVLSVVVATAQAQVAQQVASGRSSEAAACRERSKRPPRYQSLHN